MERALRTHKGIIALHEKRPIPLQDEVQSTKVIMQFILKKLCKKFKWKQTEVLTDGRNNIPQRNI